MTTTVITFNLSKEEEELPNKTLPKEVHIEEEERRKHNETRTGRQQPKVLFEI